MLVARAILNSTPPVTTDGGGLYHWGEDKERHIWGWGMGMGLKDGKGFYKRKFRWEMAFQAEGMIRERHKSGATVWAEKDATVE